MKRPLKKSIFFVLALVVLPMHIGAQNYGVKNKTNKMHVSSFNVNKPNPSIDEGRWTVNVQNGNLCIQFSDMVSDHRPSYLILNCFESIEFERSNGTNDEFQLKRLAGTMYFDKNVFSDNASGKFKFVRNKQFVSFLEERGIATDDEIYYFKLFLGDISESYISALKHMGYSPTIREIGRLVYHDVGLDYLRGMTTALKARIDLEMMIKLAAHGVGMTFVERLFEVGYGNLPPEMIKKFAVHGVDANYISTMQQLGFNNIDPNKDARTNGRLYQNLEDYIRLKKKDGKTAR